MDVQAAAELLVGQDAGDGGVAEQHLRLVGVEHGDEFGQRGGGRDVGPGRCAPHSCEQLPGEMDPARGADPHGPRVRPDPGPHTGPQRGGDPHLGLVVGEREDAPQAGGPGGRQHPVLAEERARGVRPRQMALQLATTQPGVTHDLVEVLHQRGLGQRGQRRQRSVGGPGPQRPAVVGRVRDRVLDEPAQPVRLVGEELVA